MAATVWNDLYRGLGYAVSEMGEVLSVSADSLSVSTVKAIDNKTVVLPALTTPAAAITHVVAVHPQANKLQTKG